MPSDDFLSGGEESESEMSPEMLQQMEQLDSQFDRMMAQEFNPAMMNTTGLATWGVYIFSALFTSSLTIYLYLTPMFDLTIAEHGMYFFTATAVSTVLLAMTYDKSAHNKKAALMHAREDATMTGKKSNDTVYAVLMSTVTESSAWSLFFNNAFFLAIYLFIGFYFIPRVPADLTGEFNFLASVITAALILYLYACDAI